MLFTQIPLLRLSQGQLNLLERCPRQFQHTYLDQLGSPANPEQQERQILGSHFHLLMQQREMGLPIDTFLQEDAELQRWMSAFANAAPEILKPDINSQIFRESEHYRTLQVQDYLLTVIYDLLIADDKQAQILDWKTYPDPPNKRKLQENWQTRLYLYVLAETSEYLPENISMTYWFVNSGSTLQSTKFTYSDAQHQQTEKKLEQLLNKLTSYLQRYQEGEPFPQVGISKKRCDYCQFAPRCDRNRDSEDTNTLDTTLVNLATIQEVSL